MVTPLKYIFKFILNSLEQVQDYNLIIINTFDNTNIQMFRFFPMCSSRHIKGKGF